MRELFELQRCALQSELPVTLAARCDRLDRALAMIEQNTLVLCDALDLDLGRASRATTLVAEIAPSIAALGRARADLDGWMRRGEPSLLRRLARTPSTAGYRPRGIVGVAVPSRLPLCQSLGLLAAIFAAGNRAMMRLDSRTPALAAALGQIAPRYFDPAELAFVAGNAQNGAAFDALPFDVFIAGDTAPGEDAAPFIDPAACEKSPVIFGRSADLAGAAERLIAAKMVSWGQVPLAPDHLLVPAESQDEAVSWLYRAAAARTPETDRDDAATLDDHHHARLTALIDDARRRGADILTVDLPHATMPLHIVAHATDDMRVMQEEVFGPILPIRTYRRIDDAIAHVNRGAPPLLVHYHGRDAAARQQVVDRARYHAIAVNGEPLVLSGDSALFTAPASVLARYNGEAGFRALSEAGPVDRKPMFGVKPLTAREPGDINGAASLN